VRERKATILPLSTLLMGSLLIGCSGWDYAEPPPKGWMGVFYPARRTRRLQYYSKIFDTVEMDSTFYKKLYSNMTRGLFMGMARATPEKFQFSLKVPEIITHEKKLSIDAIADFEEFLGKISPLKNANKLGAILFQLPPSFTVREFTSAERFFERLPSGYDYAVEFRHRSWSTEGPWEMLKHYNIASVIMDSPEEDLRFLSEVTVTADHSFVRWHGRNRGLWYDYLYSTNELKPWVEKVAKISATAKTVRGYFNNHFSAKAVMNTLQFIEMSGHLSEEQKKAFERAEAYLSSGKMGIERWT
jgi:uncharacterized protein YecE (DUF72 family)